jgi:hypothetical protein
MSQFWAGSNMTSIFLCRRQTQTKPFKCTPMLSFKHADEVAKMERGQSVMSKTYVSTMVAVPCFFPTRPHLRWSCANLFANVDLDY